MHQDMTNSINEQLNKEFFSAYLYLDIAGYYLNEHLDGFANWFMVQEQEEREHAMMFVKYMQDNDVKIILHDIKAPAGAYNSPKAPLETAYAHEKSITASIHQLYDKAMQLKDFRTMQFLNWFIKEQNEEEKSVKDICEKFSLLGDKKENLYLLDNELKSRSFSPAAKD